MVTTYLNNQPYSKFVLIEDSLEQRGKNILKYIIESHTRLSHCTVQYFAFEGNFEVLKKTFPQSNVELLDCVSDSRGWLNNSHKQTFMQTVSKINKEGCVIVIDSLVHAIYQYGLAIVYKIIQKLLACNEGVLRVVTILHQDLCENIDEISQSFQYLATLTLTLLDKGRVLYIYRKPSGKVIKKIEQYKFEKGILKSESIKKIDPKTLLQENLNQILPENLTTFKISLNEEEKQSRDQLVLPYLPKENKLGNTGEADSNIFYQFDHVDDWDEEDPDDDLDI